MISVESIIASARSVTFSVHPTTSFGFARTVVWIWIWKTVGTAQQYPNKPVFHPWRRRTSDRRRPDMTSRISVVITNYNYAQFLSQALDSVFAQTQRPHEVILVDDGSTDGSRAVIERYDVHAIWQANAGQSAALDAGVAAATGDVVCLLDADDAWHSTKIERVAYAFDQHPSIQWARHKLAIADARLEP